MRGSVQAGRAVLRELGDGLVDAADDRRALVGHEHRVVTRCVLMERLPFSSTWPGDPLSTSTSRITVFAGDARRHVERQRRGLELHLRYRLDDVTPSPSGGAVSVV